MATVSQLRKQGRKDEDEGEEVEGTLAEAQDDDLFPDDDDDEGPSSIEDRAQEPVEEEPKIAGVNRQLSLIAGGEEPDSSSFKMQGGSIPVEGEFEKGAVIKVLVTLSVDAIHFVDKKDKDGYVVGTERRHVAKPMSIQRA
jgi:hypothetical protein